MGKERFTFENQKWTFIQGFKSCPASLSKEEKTQLHEMCHVWDRLPSILVFLFDITFTVFGASRNMEHRELCIILYKM